MAAASRAPADVEIRAPLGDGFEDILSPDALAFVARLARAHAPAVTALLQAREARQRAIDLGEMPDFPAATRHIREADWRVTDPPADLRDRRVEITGPTDRKMIINALNSGASVFMADCEDSLSPTWTNVIQGQINLRDAVERRIDFTNPEGKRYALNAATATLTVRPRGWHLYEKHLLVDGAAVPGAFVDFGLYLFHNARSLIEQGSGPYFYLPKLEGHSEAALWAKVFADSEAWLGLPHGAIKATVLIETILAAFEVDEILHALRDYIVGLNCGRWDYIFSFIKRFRRFPEFVLPDREAVTMTTRFLRAYSLLVIQTCHRRGAYAIGGMAAQIPIKSDPGANEAALAKVRADKEREAGDGHDGTWVAHPALVPVAREIFDRHMPGPNQLARLREDVEVTAADLLAVPAGDITEAGVRTNISVAVQYLAAWLGGLGCVPLYHLMEDAATAEISRAQLWQWIHHRSRLADGRTVTPELFETLLAEELSSLEQQPREAGVAAAHLATAGGLLRRITLDDAFSEFVTSAAYERLD
ncbi:MAG TPA: malate synthase A [Gammaproteobacteria bacterium]|nr:malate synthase A [Gammaproteobacteria bacterium]